MEAEMKHALILVVSLATLSSPAFADGLTELGLDDPEVVAPANPSGDWTGLYVGLSYGRTSTEAEGVRCFKLGDPKDCNDPIFLQYPDFKVVERFTLESEDSDGAGAFLGYRHDFGNVVGGLELGVQNDLTTAEAQLGVDLGRLLVYGLAGAGEFNDASGTVYGAGADFKLGKRLMIGAKYTTGDFDGVDVESFAARLAITF
jgi:opacity protein-like surface antigen